MPTPAQYSESNILTSLAMYLAGKLLSEGYILYWHKTDVLQTGTSSTDWWYQYSINRSTYQGNGTYTAKLAAAKGLITFVEDLPAEPRFVTRLISDSSVGPADEVSVPAISLALTAEVAQDPYELGTKVKWRARHLVLDSYVRNEYEQRQFKNLLSLWFERETMIDVADFDSGSGSPPVIGTVDIQQVRVDSARFVDRAQAMTYQVMVNAFVGYVA